MATDREIEETAARCVSLLVYYHNCGRTARAREVFEADVATVAAWVAEEGLAAEAIGRRLLGPVLAALLERYDRPYAAALHEEFVSALYPPRPAAAARPAEWLITRART